MKQLEKLLFEQGGDCFFCKSPLSKADASVEHLHAQSNGGTNADENVVACCKSLNALFGNKPLKEKIHIVLRQKGEFRCPAQKTAIDKTQVKKSDAPSVALKTVTKPMQKPDSTPRLVAVTQAKPEAMPKAKSSISCPTCKTAVPKVVGQIDFKCQKCGGAFRY
jgi:hypothetical protein